jgi:hypothetical protein
VQHEARETLKMGMIRSSETSVHIKNYAALYPRRWKPSSLQILGAQILGTVGLVLKYLGLRNGDVEQRKMSRGSSVCVFSLQESLTVSKTFRQSDV